MNIYKGFVVGIVFFANSISMANSPMQAVDSSSGFNLKPGIYDNLFSDATCSWRVDYFGNTLSLSSVNRYDGTKCNGHEAMRLECFAGSDGQSMRCCGGQYGTDTDGTKWCSYIYTVYSPDVVDTQGNIPDKNFGLLKWVSNAVPKPIKFINMTSHGWEIKMDTKYCELPNRTKIACDDLDDTLIEPLCKGLKAKSISAAKMSCAAEGYKKCDVVSTYRKIVYKEPFRTLVTYTGCRWFATVVGSN
jgi:hypothetical protein